MKVRVSAIDYLSGSSVIVNMEFKSKRICFITAGLNGGGIERALTSLANYYANRGHEICIVNLFKTECFFELNNRIKIFWPSVKRERTGRIIYALIIIPYIRKSIRSFNPEVIISYGEWINPYVILITRFTGIPLFVSDRMGPEISMGRLLNLFKKLTYKFANGIIAQTKTASEIIKKKTNAINIAVIPNPVNIIETNISVKKKQIVTIGRLSKEKGHIVLIRAFANLPQKEWTLHIVGDGKERKILENEAEILGIANRVLFYGQLKDLNQILGESSIFVLPSFYEGYPNALIEAMSVPLACISSNCTAGPGEIIENNQNGILVPPGDVNAITIAMIGLIENDLLRQKLANNAYNIRERLSFDKIANKLLEFVFK